MTETILAHGRAIKVEMMDDGLPPTAPRRRRQAGAFVMVPLGQAAAAFKALRQPRAIIWVVLLYEAWRAKGKPFTLSNERLRQYGVLRDSKHRALAAWEAAGLIQVKRIGRRSSEITLLKT